MASKKGEKRKSVASATPAPPRTGGAAGAKPAKRRAASDPPAPPAAASPNAPGAKTAPVATNTATSTNEPSAAAAAGEPIAAAAQRGRGESRQERIARRAYELFLERGGEHGRDREDWLRAATEVPEHPKN